MVTTKHTGKVIRLSATQWYPKGWLCNWCERRLFDGEEFGDFATAEQIQYVCLKCLREEGFLW